MEQELQNITSGATCVQGRVLALISAARTWINEPNVRNIPRIQSKVTGEELKKLVRTALLRFHLDRIPKKVRINPVKAYQIDCLRKEFRK